MHRTLPHRDSGLAHAQAIRARGVALPPDGLPAPLILDSWARCMDVGLLPTSAVSIPVIEGAELHHRQQRAEVVRRLAKAELETLSRQIAGSNFLLAFADNEGVILDLYADNRFSMSSADAGIVAGSVWAENVAGTNGLGTALATGSAVAVTGLEHFFLKLGDVSCTAAPVRDFTGQIVGVLDASSYYESRQRHTQALVQMAATHIENGLLMHQLHGQLVLALHPRPEFLGTLSAGMVAFDAEGSLMGANGPGRHLLAGLNVMPGTRFDELFGEPLDHVLARLHRAADVKLLDALGSSLIARLVSGPVTGSGQGSARPAQRASRLGTSPAAPRQSPRAPSGIEPAFVADDPAVAEACKLVCAAVRLRAPILLHGETGTGKELLARLAHQASGRRGDFVAVNCAALSGDLFEAELFGYASGAFTGARREGHAGLIVAADGGTLLLDEIRDLPLPMQAALLRFLDDQAVRPVGGQVSRTVDVQLLAASHVDLESAVQAGSFREDLLYRLNTVRVALPPLRLRQDLPRAVRWVLRTLDPAARISDDALALLGRQPWPGNFRQLRSVLTRALLLRPPGPQDLPLGVAEFEVVLTPPTTGEAHTLSSAGQSALKLGAAERVRAAFREQGQSVTRTARALGISRTTVYRHLRG